MLLQPLTMKVPNNKGIYGPSSILEPVVILDEEIYDNFILTEVLVAEDGITDPVLCKVWSETEYPFRLLREN